MGVVFFHLHGVLTHDGQTPLFGPILDWLCEQGELGVEVFFVISGFVIAHALRPLRISGAGVGRFMLRRLVRLQPAYWAVLFATFTVNAVATHYGIIHRPPVSPGVVLVNMFCLQDILPVYAPVSVAWSLCAELQFYLFFVLLLWSFQWLRERVPRRLARLVVFGPPAVASLLLAAGHGPVLRGIYLDHWHLFFLGTVTYWTLMGVMSSIWFWIYLVFALVLCNGQLLGGVGAGLAIQGFARLGLLDSKAFGRVLAYLGSRSYSIFLVHVLIGSNLARLLLRLNWVTETYLVLVGFFVVSLAASIIAAEILFRLIEWPSHRLARRITYESSSASPVRAGADAEQVFPVGTPAEPITARGPLAAYINRRWPGIATSIRTNSAWLIPVSLFAAIWLTELFVVQELTLAPGGNYGGPNFNFFAPKIRFMMDVCFVGMCVSLLDRTGLVLAAIGSSILNLILLTYFNYYYSPLSMLHVFQNFKEGVEMSAFAWDLLDGSTILSLAAVLVVKLIILMSIPTGPRRPSPVWLGFFGCFAMAYVSLFIVANHLDPLEKIAYKHPLGRLGIIRGYLGPWIAEFYYLNDDRLIQQALERRDFKSDQLSPLEIPLQIEPRLVIIQAESLDQSVIGYRVGGKDGQEVTPFLNRLRGEAMYFRVRVFKYQGSCDSDFTMLEGVAAAPRVNPYSMPNYPFENSLPKILKQHGFHPIAFHGYHADFYKRGAAFFKLGFERSLFQETLEHDFGLPATNFGIMDQQVFRLSSQLLRESQEPTCHFIITLTSHAPYKFVTPTEDYPYPQPANDAENYFNHMRYLDDCLREYVMSLPKHTTVVIYGDHCTAVRADDFKPDRDGNLEYVPCFIYDTDRDLAEEQRTRNEPIATNGTLNLLDISNYLRGRITAADAVTSGSGQPAKDDGKPTPPQPAEKLPANSQSKAAAPSGSAAAGEPIAQRLRNKSSLEAPDDP